MGDGMGWGGWVGGSIIVALWPIVRYTQIVVCRSAGGLYSNHTSPTYETLMGIHFDVF